VRLLFHLCGRTEIDGIYGGHFAAQRLHDERGHCVTNIASSYQLIGSGDASRGSALPVGYLTMLVLRYTCSSRRSVLVIHGLQSQGLMFQVIRPLLHKNIGSRRMRSDRRNATTRQKCNGLIRDSFLFTEAPNRCMRSDVCLPKLVAVTDARSKAHSGPRCPSLSLIRKYLTLHWSFPVYPCKCRLKYDSFHCNHRYALDSVPICGA